MLLSDWIEELRRRRVLLAVLGYGVVVFAILQVVRLPDWSLTTVTVSLAAGLGTGAFLYPGRPSFVRADGLPSIAVLPFADESGDPDQGYFADGLTEEIQAALAQIPGLRVIGRTSSFAFSGKP